MSDWRKQWVDFMTVPGTKKVRYGRYSVSSAEPVSYTVAQKDAAHLLISNMTNRKVAKKAARVAIKCLRQWKGGSKILASVFLCSVHEESDDFVWLVASKTNGVTYISVGIEPTLKRVAASVKKRLLARGGSKSDAESWAHEVLKLYKEPEFD